MTPVPTLQCVCVCVSVCVDLRLGTYLWRPLQMVHFNPELQLKDQRKNKTIKDRKKTILMCCPTRNICPVGQPSDCAVIFFFPLCWWARHHHLLPQNSCVLTFFFTFLCLHVLYIYVAAFLFFVKKKSCLCCLHFALPSYSRNIYIAYRKNLHDGERVRTVVGRWRQQQR